uniref:Uncharacterized protein n=1 Tax=Rhizophora mucronata TaxID=61149 RepID=A0A2P2MEZ2_RHIMU
MEGRREDLREKEREGARDGREIDAPIIRL